MKLLSHTSKLKSFRRIFGIVTLFIAFTITAAFVRNSTKPQQINPEPPVKTVLNQTDHLFKRRICITTGCKPGPGTMDGSNP
jgi:hypothetical protein